MIKQTLIASALVAAMAAPAFAATHHDGNADRHRNAGNGRNVGAPHYVARPQRHPVGPPPRARYERRPAARNGYGWQPGYYAYANQRYEWRPGQYVRQPYAGAQYQPGSWQLINGIWSFIQGRWR